jgi:hypothetical protein
MWRSTSTPTIDNATHRTGEILKEMGLNQSPKIRAIRVLIWCGVTTDQPWPKYYLDGPQHHRGLILALRLMAAQQPGSKSSVHT